MVNVQEFTFYLGNRPGALLEIAAALAEEKVNIEAIAALTVLDEAVVAMVTDAPDRARKVLKRLGVDYEEREALTMSLPHQPGQLATVLERLARDGINVLSCYFSVEKNQLVFTVDDLARAKAIFRL
ncbi:MAG: ACT domain-containing protein [Candidatus Bipolaricaulota bacterium]|nr:ACT domain-containing protein [Candidatus Bipolaricaulota bacterium]MDW8126896.1 ACT domain-containing protein [Candidatus Bipolaricaulota bacterium]